MELDDYRRILIRLLLDTSKHTPTLSTDADRDVEITLFEDQNTLRMHSVLLNQAHTVRKICDFCVRITAKSPPKAILRLPEKAEIPFVYNGTTVTFSVTAPRLFETYEIKY